MFNWNPIGLVMHISSRVRGVLPYLGPLHYKIFGLHLGSISPPIADDDADLRVDYFRPELIDRSGHFTDGFIHHSAQISLDDFRAQATELVKDTRVLHSVKCRNI